MAALRTFLTGVTSGSRSRSSILPHEDSAANAAAVAQRRTKRGFAKLSAIVPPVIKEGKREGLLPFLPAGGSGSCGEFVALRELLFKSPQFLCLFPEQHFRKRNPAVMTKHVVLARLLEKAECVGRRSGDADKQRGHELAVFPVAVAHLDPDFIRPPGAADRGAQGPDKKAVVAREEHPLAFPSCASVSIRDDGERRDLLYA